MLKNISSIIVLTFILFIIFIICNWSTIYPIFESIDYQNYIQAEKLYIDKYNVVMDITEDKIAKITEDFTVTSKSPVSSITRTIPIKNISVQNNKFKIENIHIYDIYSEQLIKKEKANFELIILLGNLYNHNKGKQTYSLTYKYDMPNSQNKDSDVFYYNIIGTDWDRGIEQAYFSITLPKIFDTNNNIQFFKVKDGLLSKDLNIRYKISGNTIKGYTTTPLKPNEGISIQIKLPAKYFTGRKNISNNIALYSLILAVLSVIIWYIFGKDDPVTPIVNFNAPKGKNSAEIEVEYQGHSSLKGIISLIFYLASKGYIEIDDNGISFTLKKIKPYDGKKLTEKLMMQALFDGNKETISQLELECSINFQIYCQKIQQSLEKIKGFLFIKESCSFGKLAIMIISIFGLITLLLYTLGNYSFNIPPFDDPFFVLTMIFIMTIGIGVVIRLIQLKRISLALFFGFGFIGTPLIFIFISCPNIVNNAPIIFWEIACIIVSIICLVNMPKRNHTGKILLGQVLGLKKFIEVAEKSRLLNTIKENPDYVSEILPFAYVLGVENHLFDTLTGYEDYHPNWYQGEYFNEYIVNNISNSVEKATKNNEKSTKKHKKNREV